MKARLVTQTYMLQTIRSKHNTNISPLCTLCHNEDEDIQHFLLRCTCLINTRTRHLQKIQNYLDQLRHGLYNELVDSGKLLQLILDCTCNSLKYEIKMKRQYYEDIESLSRVFWYDMHHNRMKQMAGEGTVTVRSDESGSMT